MEYTEVQAAPPEDDAAIESMRRLWWLASYPKSGNTWIRMFLNAYVSHFPIDINSAYQYAVGDLQPQLYQLTSSYPILELPQLLQLYYRPAVLMNYLAGVYTRDAYLKTHNALVEIEGVRLIPPRLSKGALYLVRDPRDVVISYAKHMNKTIDEAIESMGNNGTTIASKRGLIHVLLTWSNHVNSWTIANETVPCIALRYEDLVEDTDITFRRVLAALGIPEIDEDRFQFALEQTQFENLQKQEETKGFAERARDEQFFSKGKAGGWKEVLSKEQVDKIEKQHGETMKRYNYL